MWSPSSLFRCSCPMAWTESDTFHFANGKVLAKQFSHKAP